MRNGDRRGGKKIITIALVAVVIILVCLYAGVDPAGEEWGRFFPKCPVKMLTGLQCPACGIQRSAYSLLHGDVAGALRHNWFLLFSAVYLGGILITGKFCSLFSPWRRFFWGRYGCMLYVVLYFGWFVVRNLLGV